ncbi:MAG: flagellar biosynthetic protein FliR [Candidatus Kapaibacterium sp.]
MGKFLTGLLIFARVSGLVAFGPFFNNSMVIPHVKVILTFILTVSITSIYWQDQPPLDFHLWYMVLLVIKEFSVGALLGFSANLVFYAARFAGGIIDFDMGYHTALMFNRDVGSPTLVGELKELGVLMLFLILNGHHFLIEALYASVQVVPLTVFEISESTIQLLIRMVTSVMIIGVKMSAPLLVAIFLTNLALALMARVSPQTNIFILSFQTKIFVGLLVLMATVPLFVMVAKWALGEMETETMKILMSLNPGRV